MNNNTFNFVEFGSLISDTMQKLECGHWHLRPALMGAKECTLHYALHHNENREDYTLVVTLSRQDDDSIRYQMKATRSPWDKPAGETKEITKFSIGIQYWQAKGFQQSKQSLITQSIRQAIAWVFEKQSLARTPKRVQLTAERS